MLTPGGRRRGTVLASLGMVLLLASYLVRFLSRSYRRRASAVDGRCALGGCPGNTDWELGTALMWGVWLLLAAGLGLVLVGAALTRRPRREPDQAR